MRILVLSDNFVPEQNAPAQRTFEHCRRWVQQGASVTVITTVPNFPTGVIQTPYRNRLRQREVIDGIEVIRVWSFLAPNKDVILRGLDFLSFAIGAFIAGLFEKTDVILATSPQLLTGLAGRLLARAKSKPWVFEVRDLWPESIVAVGAIKDGPVIRALEKLEGSLYRSAARIVTISEPMRDSIAGKGVPADKIGVVSNGADVARVQGSEKRDQLAAQWKPLGKFVVGYIGTHGMAQGLEVVVSAAEILRDTDVHFLFVGEGARRQELQALAQRSGLENTTFLGMVSGPEAVDYLALSDVVVVPLKKAATFESALPSKVFETAAVGRPMVVSASGHVADVVRHYDAGVVVEPGEPGQLAAAILQLRDDPALRSRLRAGCKKLARDFSRERLADLMLEEIRTVVLSHARG
ncbi:MAG: glycosyltransferase family 4 protein [Rhizomicrobium sp.]|jgi:glycosyltransferase involved in cell wall biosynthesis